MNTRIIHTINLIVVLVLSFTIALANVANAQQLYRMGPSGGLGGAFFYDKNIPNSSRVLEVQVRHGARIDAVRIVHITSDRAKHELSIHGGEGGMFSQFTLNRDEYIISIRGRYGRFVDSIRFYTNRRSSPTYGGSGGAVDFNYDVPAGFEIVGFFGHSGAIVDSIGVLIRARK